MATMAEWFEGRGRMKGRREGFELGKEQGREQGIEQGIELGREQGMELGREQGIKLERKNMAINLLKRGFNISEVAEIVELTKEDIAKL